MRQISSILCLLFFGTSVLLPVCAAPGSEDLTSKAKDSSTNAGSDKRSASTAGKSSDSGKNDVSKTKSATQAVKNGVTSTRSVTTSVSPSAVANVNAKAANTNAKAANTNAKAANTNAKAANTSPKASNSSPAIDRKSTKSADANLASSSARNPGKNVDAEAAAVKTVGTVNTVEPVLVKSVGTVKTIEPAPAKSVGAAPVKTLRTAPVKIVETASVKSVGTAPVKAVGIAPVKTTETAPVTSAGTALVKTVGTASVKSVEIAPVKSAGTAPVKTVGTAPVKSVEIAPVKSAGTAPVKTVGTTTSIKSDEASAVAVSGTAAAKSVGITHGNVKDAKTLTDSKETSTKTVSAASSKSGAIEAKTDKNAKPNKIEHKSFVKGEKSRPPAMLVPPPPPSVPTMGEMGMPMGGPTMIFMGENIDYMSAADLKDLNDKTERDLQRMRRDVEDMVSSSTEKKQRASSFDQLFAEGVISRKELETAKHENERAIQDLSDAKQNLALLEQKHVRIEQRLAFLSKSKNNKQSGSRKKTSRVKK